MIHIRCTSVAAVPNQSYERKITCNLPGRFFLSFSFGDSFFDSVLPFTPHNPKSLHNFLGGWVFFEKQLGCVGLWDNVSHYAPEPDFHILRMLNLRLNAKSNVGEYSRDVQICDIRKVVWFFFILSDILTLHIEMTF